MNLLHIGLPFVGQLLLLAVLLVLLLGRFINGKAQRLIAVTLLLVAGLFLPLYGLTAAQWLRTLLGDLSLLSLVIFCNILAQRLFQYQLLQTASRRYLLWGVALTGVLFYPLALGLGAFDPYQIGYAPVAMPAALGMISIIAWLKNLRDLAVILILPLIAFNLHLLESGNLWDYLLDPVVLVYALVQLMAGAVAKNKYSI